MSLLLMPSFKRQQKTRNEGKARERRAARHSVPERLHQRGKVLQLLWNHHAGFTDTHK